MIPWCNPRWCSLTTQVLQSSSCAEQHCGTLKDRFVYLESKGVSNSDRNHFLWEFLPRRQLCVKVKDWLIVGYVLKCGRCGPTVPPQDVTQCRRDRRGWPLNTTRFVIHCCHLVHTLNSFTETFNSRSSSVCLSCPLLCAPHQTGVTLLLFEPHCLKLSAPFSSICV